jgi:hypothetical protein
MPAQIVFYFLPLANLSLLSCIDDKVSVLATHQNQAPQSMSLEITIGFSLYSPKSSRANKHTPKASK